MTARAGQGMRRSTLQVDVLSPLHIGSGESPLVANRDFVIEGGSARIIDSDALIDIAGMEALTRAADLFQRRPGLRERVTQRSLPLRGHGSPREVRTFIRTAFGVAYVPGSSLKGLIRTALAWSADQSQAIGDLGGRPEFAARALEQRLFGPDPNHDALRALRVSDCPQRGDGNFEVTAAGIYVRALDRRDLPELRPRARHGNTIAVEAAVRGASFSGSIVLEPRLLSAREGARPLFTGGGTAFIPDWVAACRDFGRVLIEHEQRFFAEAAPSGAQRRFYKQLAALSAQLPENQALAQLGWGTSWRAKTIGLRLTPEQIQHLRERYSGPLSRWHGAEFPRIFPRSRKLCEDREDKPQLPLGWVRLTALPAE